MFQWSRTLTIAQKVAIIAGLGITGILCYFAYSIVLTQQINNFYNKMEERELPVIQNSIKAGELIIELKEDFRGAYEAGDEDFLADALVKSDELASIYAKIIVLDESLKVEVEELQSLLTFFVTSGEELVNSALGTDIEEVSPEELEQKSWAYSDSVAPLVNRQTEFMSQLIKNIKTDLHVQDESNQNAQFLGLITGIAMLLVVVAVSLSFSRKIRFDLNGVIDAAGSIAQGEWDKELGLNKDSNDETGRLSIALLDMLANLRSQRDADTREADIKTKISQLNDAMRGEEDLSALSSKVLSELVPALNAQLGALYLFDDGKLDLVGSYAFTRRKGVSNSYELGESLVGQAGLEQKQIIVSDIPADYISIGSGTGEAVPKQIIVTPLTYENELKAILEIASFYEFSEADIEVLDRGANGLAIAIHSAQARDQVQKMLVKTQEQASVLEKQQNDMEAINADLEAQAMELASSQDSLLQQQEELKVTNEELEEQTQALRASEESLQAQQEELRVINEELEEQANILSQQKGEIEKKNNDLENKSKELELSSKYKSEFLSTMSHELRTPLNSILILSNSLADNKKGNLSDKQVEHASVINSAGSDLLALINDILDISKIEEGKMDIIVDRVSLPDLQEHMRLSFQHVAEDRGLSLEVYLDENLPDFIYTDKQRIEQVLRNLFSNAFKFTEQGSVNLHIRIPSIDVSNRLNIPEGGAVEFSVVDSGIGIPADKQALIFEAFQQADGTTSRKYGGTGLGLTISREFCRLLGGELVVSSEGENKGSTFSIVIPVGNDEGLEEADTTMFGSQTAKNKPPVFQERTEAEPRQQEIEKNDPDEIVVREKNILIIEDDNVFTSVLSDMAKEYGFEVEACADGESGLEFAIKYRPSAIILDIGLPGISGWEVMEKLKSDPRTNGIPVHFLSGEDEKSKAQQVGAIDFLQKPVSDDQMANAFRKIEDAMTGNVRRLLVVEDNEVQSNSIIELFGDKGVELTMAATGEAALKALEEQVIDCVVLDLSLPDISGYDLLEKIRTDERYKSIPVIVYTAQDLNREEEARLRKYADRIILKTDRSSERLLNEASLFLHWLGSKEEAAQTDQHQQFGEHRDDVFEGKCALVVDDDMRNIYALTTTLEEWGLEITIANDGLEAIKAVEDNEPFDIVLMDIMMPNMDGYEAMKHLRGIPEHANLPILALTAKAMKEDREKCINAGANDYITKPIDIDKLASLMRVWLHK